MAVHRGGGAAMRTGIAHARVAPCRRAAAMSRAFVKETDGDEAAGALPEKPQSAHPNYVTVAGLERITRMIEDLRRRRDALRNDAALSARPALRAIETEIRYLEKRVQCAIPVAPPERAPEDIRFGATVDLIDADDRHYCFTIVGEDESDARAGRISWVSPLARELIAKKAGQDVVWRRPAGTLELTVVSFRYEQSAGSGVSPAERAPR